MAYEVKLDELKEILRKLEENEEPWMKQLTYEKEKPILENIVKLVIQKLDEGAKVVYISEADIKSVIVHLYDELHLLGRFRKCIRGTGLSVAVINDLKINDGKRSYKVYNTKLRFGVVDME